jgi:hypothetical protein
MRLYLAFSNGTMATLLGGNDPTASYFGGFFSSGIHATNFYYQRNDNSVGGNRGVMPSFSFAANTVYYLLLAWLATGTAYAVLYSSSFALLTNTVPDAGNMPATTTPLGIVMGVADTGGAAGVNLDIFRMHALNNT